MNHPLRLAAALLAVVFAGQAHAQGVIQQLGTPTPGHLGMFVGNGQMMDAGGPSAAGQAPPNSALPGTRPSGIGVVNSGQGFAQYSGYSNTQPYSEFKWGFDGNGNALITIDGVGGSTPGCNLSLNGTVTPCFSTGTGNVNGPGTTTVNHLPSWNNTTGTLLNDSGYAFLTPEDYGAAGNGSTNDSVAMQAAINAAQTLHAKLWLGPKTYLATDLLINQAMTLTGSGPFSSILKNPTVGASSSILKIGYTAPTDAQVQGVTVDNVGFSGNSPTGGWALSAKHVANVTAQNIFLDQVYCGIEVEQANNVILTNVWGYTRGTGCAALKWWTDPTAQAAGGRSDQLYVTNYAVNNQYYGNDGFWWTGMTNTLNAVNMIFLQSKRGFWVDAGQNDVSHFPAFASVYNLQIEGAQTAACEIDGGRYIYFTDSFCYNVPGGSGPGGSQGNADTTAFWVKPDGTASITSSIQFKGGSIGIAQKEAAIIQAQGVYLDATQFRGSSLTAANTYPSLRLKYDGVNGSADYVLSNVKFCGVFGDTVQNNYGVIREAGVGQTILTAGNFTYCQVGEIQDNAVDRLVVSASTDRNGKRLPESTRVFISNNAPILADDCAGANATIDPTSNNVMGTIGVTAGAPVKTTCTITFANTNAANNNGIGNLRAALIQAPAGSSHWFVVTGATANAINIQREDAGDLSGFTIPYIVFPEK